MANRCLLLVVPAQWMETLDGIGVLTADVQTKMVI